jgi:hypothetical protein
MFNRCFVAVLVSLYSPLLAASSFSKADKELLQVDTYIQQKIEPLTKVPAKQLDKTWIKAKVTQMVEVDQFLRKYFESPLRFEYPPEEMSYLRSQINARSAKYDREHANELKKILAQYQWLRISEFGDKTDRDAWLLVQHADHDPAFQSDVLKVLENMVTLNETNTSNYAYLYDRVASSFSDPSKQKLQRYGTQGKCTGPGTWEPHPVEDPANLDKRRATVGLPPESEYKKMFKDICKKSD